MSRTKAEAAANPMPGDRWPRSHDALIAERAEGKEVGFFGNDYHEIRDGQIWRPVNRYNTDLAAIARAMEAWRGQEPRHRKYRVYSPEYEGEKWCAECLHRVRDTGGIYHCDKEWYHTESAARAAALLRALGGGA